MGASPAYLFGVATVFLAVGCGKPNVEQTCTMNGFGSGECSFTNTGTAAGSVCGKIIVQKKGDETETSESSVFCSGEVGKQSTTKVEFKIPGVSTMCSGGNWQNNCDFVFKANDANSAPKENSGAAKAKAADEAERAQLDKLTNDLKQQNEAIAAAHAAVARAESEADRAAAQAKLLAAQEQRRRPQANIAALKGGGDGRPTTPKPACTCQAGDPLCSCL